MDAICNHEVDGRMFIIWARPDEFGTWTVDVTERSIHTGPGGGPEWTAEWPSDEIRYTSAELAISASIRDVEDTVEDDEGAS